jgi:hypothetical protein
LGFYDGVLTVVGVDVPLKTREESAAFHSELVEALGKAYGAAGHHSLDYDKWDSVATPVGEVAVAVVRDADGDPAVSLEMKHGYYPISDSRRFVAMTIRETQAVMAAINLEAGPDVSAITVSFSVSLLTDGNPDGQLLCSLDGLASSNNTLAYLGKLPYSGGITVTDPESRFAFRMSGDFKRSDGTTGQFRVERISTGYR